MSRQITFLDKVKAFTKFMLKKKDIVVVNCGMCKSTSITFEKREESCYHKEVVYRSEYTCSKCGATCQNTQYWEK